MREVVTAENIYCAYENEANGLDFKLVRTSAATKSMSISGVQRNLFVYPAQSNFNGRKYDFDLIESVKNEHLMNRGNSKILKDKYSFFLIFQQNNWTPKSR